MTLSPTSWPGGGGGSYTAPVTRELIVGLGKNILNGAQGNLTWDTHQDGDNLLDLTTPAAPAVVTAGVYVVAVQVAPGSVMTADGSYSVLLDLDLNGDDAQVTADSPGANANQPQPRLALTLAYYLPAGAVLRARVANRDGVLDLDFYVIHAVIQRVS